MWIFHGYIYNVWIKASFCGSIPLLLSIIKKNSDGEIIVHRFGDEKSNHFSMQKLWHISRQVIGRQIMLTARYNCFLSICDHADHLNECYGNNLSKLCVNNYRPSSGIQISETPQSYIRK